ncbi:SphA family protein [Ideonella livida]|uniref:Phenol degradation protein meta n=1 Tax=Ideonella livida TaxID=2707176 RepID=A0A7C9TIL7_9BURK|nr:transporter [Ideonella livida]NDY90363.1 hypothetical protein [Ideonella livida]
MTPRCNTLAALAAVAALAAAALPVAHATEGGGSIYPHGVENYMGGALPPPGTYGIVYGNVYSADRVNDANGHDLNLPGFKVRANVVAPRFVWVTGEKLLGGDLVVHAIAPLVDLSVTTPGGHFHKTGLGDMTVGLGTGFHYSPNLHAVFALDVMLPTGGYDQAEPSIGRNYLAFEPVVAVTRVDPAGLNADIKAGLIVNQRNKDTDVTSGRELHFDYALGWGLANGWVAGVGGYVYQQLNEDQQGGASLSGSKGKALAIGPSVKYDSGKGWFVTAKWQKETTAENRAQGNALWLKAVFPL